MGPNSIGRGHAQQLSVNKELFKAELSIQVQRLHSHLS